MIVVMMKMKHHDNRDDDPDDVNKCVGDDDVDEDDFSLIKGYKKPD